MRSFFIGVGLVFILGGLRAVITRAPLTWKTGGHRYGPAETYVDIPARGSVVLGYVAIALGVALMLLPLIRRTRWWINFTSSPVKHTPPDTHPDSKAYVIPPPRPPAPPRGFPRIKRDE